MADVVKFIILCHNRGAKGTQGLFPHESGIPAEPWETTSHSVDWMELGCLASPHIHNKNTNRHTKAGFEWFICLAHGLTEPELKIKCAVWTPVSYSALVIFHFFKLPAQSSLSCFQRTQSSVVHMSFFDLLQHCLLSSCLIKINLSRFINIKISSSSS